MCSNEGAASPGLTYPISTMGKLNESPPAPNPMQPMAAANGLLPFDHYRLQLYNYAVAERLRFAQYPAPLPIYPSPYGPRLALSMSLFHQRMLQPEEPKPQHSYIGLIAMAILSSPETKLVLSDIYQHILDNYPYFRTRGPGWRNSIRHNLSLNDCFVKAGRSANGKGHYWAIHPANVEDFRKGDFRRRKAQRKVRKHMGLAVDEEGNDSPSPPPISPTPGALPVTPNSLYGSGTWHRPTVGPAPTGYSATGSTRKRQFDVASLLAPDEDRRKQLRQNDSDEEQREAEVDVDVVSSDHEGGPPSPPTPADHQPWTALGPWPPALGIDPRLLGRYYGQLAAAQARVGQASPTEGYQTPPSDP